MQIYKVKHIKMYNYNIHMYIIHHMIKKVITIVEYLRKCILDEKR